MRTLKINKQKMYYALFRESETIYKLDENGNKIVIYTDYDTTPPTDYYEDLGTSEEGYYEPVKFYGNIVLSGGDIAEREYGISVEKYEAVLIVDRDAIPIDEKSLIWFQTEPTVDQDGHALSESADYRVVKVNKSLNSAKYVLSKVVK